MKDLDFVVIGAQKCATTTLFELLRQHPEVNMPIEKEVPFFTGEDCSPESWHQFAERYFAPGSGRLWGKASPQYMANADVPARLAALMPQVKMVAVLRDPIDRCRSHYRMSLRRNTETRSFAAAIESCLHPLTLAMARAERAPSHALGYESESQFYLAWSEYGRVLRGYRAHFPAEQLLVVYLEDLEKNPESVLEQVLRFLDLDADFKPRGLGDIMHAGGGGNRIPSGVRHTIRNLAPISALWSLVPPQQQGRIRFLYERWNTRKTKEALPLPPALEAELREHFANDLAFLDHIDVPTPPWADQYRRDDPQAPCVQSTAATA